MYSNKAFVSLLPKKSLAARREADLPPARLGLGVSYFVQVEFSFSPVTSKPKDSDALLIRILGLVRFDLSVVADVDSATPESVKFPDVPHHLVDVAVGKPVFGLCLDYRPTKS